MQPIFQIDPELNRKLGHDFNADLANIQEAANMPDPDQAGRAFRRAYEADLQSFRSDPDAGGVLVGTTIKVAEATTVQYDLHDLMAKANLIDDSTDALLRTPACTGPISRPGNWWNWSYADWGFVAGVQSDPSLALATVPKITTNQDGTVSVEWVTGPASPQPAQ